VALQKKAGIAEASAEGSLALDRRITEGWKGAAGEVVFSYSIKDEDRELSASPLIADVPEGGAEAPAFPRYRDLVFRQQSLSTQEDSRAPAVQVRRIRGGTKVLADQAACPFRAFARWRLGAKPLETPVDGLDAAKRGVLLHALMKNLWGLLKDSAALQGAVGPAIEQAADAAVKELGIEGRFAELERARLARLARAWLEVEKGRAPFAVVSIEEKRDLRVAGLEFSSRIDRMDRLEGGGHALIDYKTGQVSRQGWLGERPEEPQLPIYAVHATQDVDAVTFARLQPGKMGFSGYGREKGLLPKVEQAKDWNGLVRSWKNEIEALGAGFASGEARVDPKKLLQTCRKCDLQTLCRVSEKLDGLSLGEAAVEEGE
jgi:probable DNA repair protein